MNAKTIAIADYGMGNLHSVASALEYVAPGMRINVTSSLAEIEDADHVVFPGVGAIRDCVAEIKRLGFDKAVIQALDQGKPLMGICVGMQSLLDVSEENKGIACLGLVPGSVRFFSGNPKFVDAGDKYTASHGRLKVPHMGWNEVVQKIDHPLWHAIPQSSRFYFVHSYYVELSDPALEAGCTEHGISFTAAVARKNLFAVQFHPEKSHTHGLQLLKNFVHWNGQL